MSGLVAQVHPRDTLKRSRHPLARSFPVRLGLPFHYTATLVKGLRCPRLLQTRGPRETAVEEWAEAASLFVYRKDEICLELSFPSANATKDRLQIGRLWHRQIDGMVNAVRINL